MLRDRVQDYFIGKDFNCAEAMLRAANDEFGLGIDKDALKLVGGYGGGLYSEKTCGALLGSIAAISYFMIDERAHATDGIKDTISGFRNEFIEKLGSDQCVELKPKWRPNDEVRCMPLLVEACDLLEKQLLALGAKPVK